MVYTVGSIADAVRFADVDLPIWIETEGAVEHVEGTMPSLSVYISTIDPTHFNAPSRIAHSLIYINFSYVFLHLLLYMRIINHPLI